MSKHRYRKISTRIWGDANFRSFSNEAKLVWFFVLTHPQMTSMGAMRTTIPGLAAELGWTEKAFREAFREALSKGMVKVDEKASLLVVPKFLSHNPPESPNVVTSWNSQWELLPECDLLSLYLQEVKAFTEGLGEGFRKAFAIPLSKGMPYPDPDPELEHDLDIESTTYSCAEPEAVSTQQKQFDAIMRFPIIGKNGETFGLKQSKFDEWVETFGASLNVPHELRRARQWLLDNPERQRTSRGIVRFLSGWLDDAQNRRGGKNAPTSPVTPQMAPEPMRDRVVNHRGFVAAYSVDGGKVDHFLVSRGQLSWRIPSGLPEPEAVTTIRDQIDGKIESMKNHLTPRAD